MKVCLRPDVSEFKSDIGGVNRVVADLTRYLPDLGVEIVSDPSSADVVHCHAVTWDPRVNIYTNHGFYSEPVTPWEIHAAKVMSKLITSAGIVTSVSEWSPRLYEDRFRVKARVIRNGVPIKSLAHTPKGRILREHGFDKPFFLWGKNMLRSKAACAAAVDLARACPDIPFIMTFSPAGMIVPKNVHITGAVPYKTMKMMIRDCLALVATERECFSVQHIEAMAMGKPIIGWRHGGAAEIVVEDENGYLVDPDKPLFPLVEPLLDNYERLSNTAREMANGYDLHKVILPQYISCYEECMGITEYTNVASVIITCYNKESVITDAVKSALSQAFAYPFEVLVIDDCSTDGSRDVLIDLQKRFPGLKLIFNEENIGAAMSRNKAIEATESEFVVPLDGDDWIDSEYLARLYPIIRDDKSLGIVYCDFVRFGEMPGPVVGKDWDYENLLDHNFVPCCSMFRKEAWRRCGGYRQMFGWEDWDFWIAIGEIGYSGARIPEVLFHYRSTSTSKGWESAVRAKDLAASIRAAHPQYRGPTDDEIETSQKFFRHYLEIKAKQEEEQIVEESIVEDPIVEEEFPAESEFPISNDCTEEYIEEYVEDNKKQENLDVKEVQLRYTGGLRAPLTIYGTSGKRYQFSGRVPVNILAKDIDSILKTGLFEEFINGE